MKEHPSWLDLDAYHLGEGDAAVQRHVQNCVRCERYLRSLSPNDSLPDWLANVPAPPTRSRYKPAIALAATAVLACLFALGFQVSKPQTRSKHTPSVLVHARQGERVTLWDGRSPFSEGDGVRFEVQPSGFERVAVVLNEADSAQLLYEGPVQPDGLMPISFSFDSASAAEVVDVVLSHQQLDLNAAAVAAQKRTQNEQLWVAHFVFPRAPSIEARP
jgi:hypothetical protein